MARLKPRIRPLAEALGLLCLLASLSVADADAAWIQPDPISVEGLQAREPQIAVDGQGNLTAAWVSGTSSRSIFVAERLVGGQWSPPVARIAATNDCHDPKLDVNPNGAAILVADCKSGTTPMRSASRTASGAWGGSIEVPGSGSGEEPRVALDDAGNAIAVWTAATVVQSSYRKATGGWEATPLQVSPAGKVSHAPDVAVSSTGRAIAIWLEDRDTAPGDEVVQVDSISRQGSAAWSGFKFLSGTATGTSPIAAEPQVTINAGGRIAAWSQQAVAPAPPFLKNAWGSPGDFSSWGEGGSHVASDGLHAVEAPQIALDGMGRAVAVWRAFDGTFGVQASTTGFINGSWTSPITLVGSGGNVGLEPDVAVDPEGDATIVWSIGGTASAVRRPAGGALIPPGTGISDPAHPVFEQPLVAIDTDGDSFAVWSAEDSSFTHIEVAIDDVTAPLLSALSAPDTVPVGQAAAMSAVARDDWSAVAIGWDFGDGTTATGPTVSHTYASPGARVVTVTATDAVGNTSSRTLPISVTAPSSVPSGSAGRPVVLVAKVPQQTWGKIAALKAIKLRCRLDVAGTCAVKATIRADTARRIGLKLGKTQKKAIVGRGSAKTVANRFALVRVKLTKAARRAIAAAIKPVAVKLAISGSAPGRQPAALVRQLKINRP